MKIAVLVPAYNAEKYLNKCIDSLLNQTHTDLEVFCCDDGSKDGTLEILKSYSNKTKRVHYFTQANAGVCATRNHLLDELPLEFEAFAFVDSDDSVLPETYAVLSETMTRTGADIVEFEYDDGAEKIIDDMSIFLLHRTKIGRGGHSVCTKLYRRSSCVAVRFHEELAYEEDYYYNFELNATVKRKVLIAGNYYQAYHNPESVTHKVNLAKYVNSACARVRLSQLDFINAGRVPSALEFEFRKELAKDAYRMCIRKNLKKNKNPSERKELFLLAGKLLGALSRNDGFQIAGLNPLQQLIFKACLKGNYLFAQAAIFLT